MPHSYTQWSHLWLEEDSPLFMVCKVIFSMLRLISDNPCCWTRCCCDCPRVSELLLGIPELDLKSDLLPLNLLVALANRLLMTSPSSWSPPSPTPMAAATAICRGVGRNLNMGGHTVDRKSVTHYYVIFYMFGSPKPDPPCPPGLLRPWSDL